MKTTPKKKAQKTTTKQPKKQLDTLSLYDLELVNGGVRSPGSGTKDIN
ncbi:MAG TPA: hypothetical protein VFS43_19730 [Polyangiaceae bacterium]|nr:hypothetical protein [Polyangiaceae bacterium]